MSLNGERDRERRQWVKKKRILRYLFFCARWLFIIIAFCVFFYWLVRSTGFELYEDLQKRWKHFFNLVFENDKIVRDGIPVASWMLLTNDWINFLLPKKNEDRKQHEKISIRLLNAVETKHKKKTMKNSEEKPVKNIFTINGKKL